MEEGAERMLETSGWEDAVSWTHRCCTQRIHRSSGDLHKIKPASQAAFQQATRLLGLNGLQANKKKRHEGGRGEHVGRACREQKWGVGGGFVHACGSHPVDETTSGTPSKTSTF